MVIMKCASDFMLQHLTTKVK